MSALGIGTVGIREIAKSKNNRTALQETFSRLFTINTISTSIAMSVLLVAMHTIDKLQENYELMWIGVLKLLFNYLLIEWFFKGLENFKYVTNRTIIIRCMYVVSVFIFVKDAQDVTVYYLLTIGSIVINAIINILYASKIVTIKFCFSSLRRHTKSICTMGAYNVLTSMYTTFNVAMQH